MERYICIHGHFYQPPRENPWLEAIELQDSAYPYHDWNERVAVECYAPNANSRMLDDEAKIINIVNNYSSMSFNFGPTLLSWLVEKMPQVYQAILEADAKSQNKFSGHGSAIAQVYNHIIMPLANERDKRTQIRWGISDFEYRFGRKPEGMWLAETAVDTQTLEILSEFGIRFTILSPFQAKRYRHINNGEWEDGTNGRIDPSTPYSLQLPSGRSISIFFYDGPISQAVAFENLLEKGELLANRLLGAFSENRPFPQIVHIATDGESYGHHHTKGDMALAHAMHWIEKNSDVKLTVYGEFLAKHPPEFEVEIQENTSWSCPHGIERWQSDCGCNSGKTNWTQQWRTPLRESLNWLRDSLIPEWENDIQELIKDPWQTRDDYIAVILDRSKENLIEFLLDHGTHELSEEERVRALKLLELQRHAMLMFTSCGWFFDDISGIETVQIIAYAGRVIQLAEELFERAIENTFLEKLDAAVSNVPDHNNGKNIYEKWVKPSVTDWKQVVAHYGVSSLFRDFSDSEKLYCFEINKLGVDNWSAGKAKLIVGKVQVRSEITLSTQDFCFGFLHFGDHNVNGGVSQFPSNDDFQKIKNEIHNAFQKADFPEIIRIFDRGFGGSTYSLKSLFRDEQRKVLHSLLQSNISEAGEVYRRMYEDQLPTIRFLADLRVPLPQALRTAMEFVITNEK